MKKIHSVVKYKFGTFVCSYKPSLPYKNFRFNFKFNTAHACMTAYMHTHTCTHTPPSNELSILECRKDSQSKLNNCGMRNKEVMD